jgi:hypothetical protein
MVRIGQMGLTLPPATGVHQSSKWAIAENEYQVQEVCLDML